MEFETGNKVQVKCRIPLSLDNEIKAIVKKEGTTYTSVLVEFLKAALKEYKKNKVKVDEVR